MKEPKGHYEDDELNEGECFGCGEAWPCKKWRTWTKSDAYRIRELESKVERLMLNSAGLRKEAARDRKTLGRLDLFVRGGVARMVHDLARSGRAGSLDETLTRDVFDSDAAGYTQYVPGRAEYTVTHQDNAGNTWRNNQWEGQEISS